MTRSEYADFQKSEIYQKLMYLLKAGEEAAIESLIEDGYLEVRYAVKVYREIQAVLREGDVLIDD